MLQINPEKVRHIIAEARIFDGKEANSDPDSGSNPTDDGMVAVLEDHRDDPTSQELRSFVHGLTEDEQVDLVALMWLGRGDGDLGDWCALRREAARLHNNHTAQYLLGKPLLAEHLDEALSQLGYGRGD